MPRKSRSLDLTKNVEYVREKDLEDKMSMLKETEVVEKKRGRKKVVEEPVKSVEEPVFDAKGYIDDMFKGYLEGLKKPVEVIEPSVPPESKKKKEKKKVEKVEKPKAEKPKAEKKPQKNIVEVNNEDMLRAEYEREIRKRMMNNLFDY